jgi:signal peptidase
MGFKKVGVIVLELIVVVAVLFLVPGSILGQPIFLSYVETESMSPTLEPGDGFIAVPAEIDSSVAECDVFACKTEKIQKDGS